MVFFSLAGLGVPWDAERLPDFDFVRLDEGDLLPPFGRPLDLFSDVFLSGLGVPWDEERLPIFDFGGLDDGRVFALVAGEVLVGEESVLLSSFELLGAGIVLATLVDLPMCGVLPSVRRLANWDLAVL